VGLITAMGGPQATVERLDTFFDDGHFDPSNEPSFHIPLLYTFAGRPDRTQARLRALEDAHFTTGPGDPTWTISTPRVARVTLHLDPAVYPGGTFEIAVEGDPATEPYIRSAILNGAPLDPPWITQARIAAGGRLTLVLGAHPSTWGQ